MAKDQLTYKNVNVTLEWLGINPNSAEGKRLGPDPNCHAGTDGDCIWKYCPQLRDNEPGKSGRHCPIDYGWGDDY